MKKLFILTLLLCLSTSVFAKKMRIAVMDFKADGVSKGTARKVSELIRGNMINTGKFIVTERAQMNQILKEQGFQRSGCTDVTCAVKIGKILSARKILVGTVMKMGGAIVITGRIVDVESGTGEFSEDEEVESEKKLYKGVKTFTQKLTGRIQGEISMASYSDDEELDTTSYSDEELDIDSNNDDKLNTEAKQKKVDTNHPDYSKPSIAAIASIFPFYSGSWNAKFNGLGFMFVLVKGFTWPVLITLGPQDNSGTRGLMGVCVLAGTIFDMVYSYHYAKTNNATLGRLSNDNNNVYYSLTPRFYINNCSNNLSKPEGLNLTATYRF